jgi:hypothetical protein
MRGWGQEKLNVWLGELRIFCDQILFLQKNQNDYKKTNFMPISYPLRKFKKISTKNFSAEKWRNWKSFNTAQNATLYTFMVFFVILALSGNFEVKRTENGSKNICSSFWEYERREKL